MVQQSQSAGDIEQLRECHAAARTDLEASRHVFNGKPCYILRDPVTFESHRLSVADYRIIARLRHDQLLGETFQELVKLNYVKQEDESNFYQFIVRLHKVGLLTLPLNDGKQLFARFEERKRLMKQNPLMSILFCRVPMFNPDSFLRHTLHYGGLLYTKLFFVVWLAMMAVGGFLLWQRFDDFTHPLNDVLVMSNLPMLWGVLLGLKIIHEFGHAYACKKFGGNVPEMGAFFMMFNPCAYVDASAAWGFPSARQRIIVSLGGMYFESIAGFFALLVWCFTGPSFINSAAHMAVVMATVVTLFFNVNPLMKYDGYYIMCDLLGIPNMRQRAVTATNDFFKRACLGISPAQAPGSWRMQLLLLSYGICAMLYRTTIVLGISAVIATKFLVPGLLLALFYIASSWGKALIKVCKFLWHAQETALVRVRAIAISVLMLVGVPFAAFTVPIPVEVRCSGYLSNENEHRVYLPAAGVVTEVLARPGQDIGGAPMLLCRLENVDAQSDLLAAVAEMQRARQQYRTEQVLDRAKAQQTLQQMIYLQRRVEDAQRHVGDLKVVADTKGKIVQCVSPDEKGNFLPQGYPIATITSGNWTIRALVDEEQFIDVRPTVGQEVKCRLIADPSRSVSGRIVRVAPAGETIVENLALTQLGGGNIAVNPSTFHAQHSFFELEVQLNDEEVGENWMYGMTANVALDRVRDTLASRAYRKLLQFINKVMAS
ncbi:MAG: putative peptide zinc metalloprotease protein [Pirellulaceae bacterium]|jgi:putative peptide zinc metalloprotease protein